MRRPISLGILLLAIVYHPLNVQAAAVQVAGVEAVYRAAASLDAAALAKLQPVLNSKGENGWDCPASFGL